MNHKIFRRTEMRGGKGERHKIPTISNKTVNVSAIRVDFNILVFRFSRCYICVRKKNFHLRVFGGTFI